MIKDLYKRYPCRNLELRNLVHQLFEFGRQLAQESSAATSSGLNEHAVTRQTACLARAKQQITLLAGAPEPDFPATHPISWEPINMETPYNEFTQPTGGDVLPINETASLLCEYWVSLCAELAMCQSASAAGGLNKHDAKRAMASLERMAKLLEASVEQEPLDLPDTANASTVLQPRTVK